MNQCKSSITGPRQTQQIIYETSLINTKTKTKTQEFQDKCVNVCGSSSLWDAHDTHSPIVIDTDKNKVKMLICHISEKQWVQGYQI